MRPLGLPKSEGVARITLAQSAALILPFLVVARTDADRYAVLLGVALITALAWEGLFAALRKHPASAHGTTTALVFAIIAPPDVALWQLVTALSMGVIFGELVFGGRGFGFLNPATVALSLLVISAPDLTLSAQTPELALATLPGAVLLFALGLVSGRVILAAFGAVTLTLALAGQGVDLLNLATGLTFGSIYLIADPTAAAATNTGRWIYGALAGGLVGLFSLAGTITFEALVFAAVTAGVFAPLIDHLVVLAHVARRNRRHHA